MSQDPCDSMTQLEWIRNANFDYHDLALGVKMATFVDGVPPLIILSTPQHFDRRPAAAETILHATTFIGSQPWIPGMPTRRPEWERVDRGRR